MPTLIARCLLTSLTVAGLFCAATDNYLFGLAYKYAFGELTFDAEKEDPTATFRLMLADGTEHYKITLTRSQLTP